MSKNQKLALDPIYAQLINDPPRKPRETERPTVVQNENVEVLIETDNEDEFTSSGVSEDEDYEEEEEEEMETNHCQEGNILQPFKSARLRANFKTHNGNLTPLQAENVLETAHMNNDLLIAQTMAVLAAKHRHTKPINSKSTERDILSFVGPCPLYSLSSSFGLDMHHGLSNFPCRHVLADGGGHQPAPSLWQHLTAYHNLNLSSSSLLISHLLHHGYSISTPVLFPSNHSKSVLRTTPRFTFVKKCPLTKYGVYGIRYEHGTRLCSGYTYNTNIYTHLIAFHKMTDEAALRLSRAIAVHDKQFRFQANEILLNESIQYPPLKIRQIKHNHRLKSKHGHVTKTVLPQQPVKITPN